MEEYPLSTQIVEMGNSPYDIGVPYYWDGGPYDCDGAGGGPYFGAGIGPYDGVGGGP